MSGATLNQVLGFKTLSGVIQAVKPGVPRPLPETYYTTNRRVSGDTLRYKQVSGTRKLARQVDRQQPASEYTPSGVAKKIVTMPSYKEKMTIDPYDMENLMSDDGAKEELGRDEIARQVEELGQLFINSAATAAHKMLFGGGILYFDSDGNLLPSSSGAVITVDAEIPASNTGQCLLIDGSTVIISASWETASTPIMKQLNQFKTTALQRTGYPIQTAIYSDNIVDYFLSNDDIGAIMQSNGSLTSSFESGVIPNGFANIPEWVNGSSAMWEDKDGTNQTILGANEIAFLPAAERSWLETAEGSAFVPSSGIFGGADEAADAITQVMGKYAYAWLEKNPVAAQMVAGLVQLPVIKVPGAVWLADVTTIA